jgi:hypothetical protein
MATLARQPSKLPIGNIPKASTKGEFAWAVPREQQAIDTPDKDKVACHYDNNH